MKMVINKVLAIIERDDKILLFKRGTHWTLPEMISDRHEDTLHEMLKTEFLLPSNLYKLHRVCDITQNGPEPNDMEYLHYYYVHGISKNWEPHYINTNKYTECKWFDPQLTFNEPLTYNTLYIQKCYNALRVIRDTYK